MANIELKPLPAKDASDYFRTLVRNCIEAYKVMPNDTMCLDINRVSGKLRAMVLNDEEYRQETRNIYAMRCLSEIEEIDDIARQVAHEDGEDGWKDPREKGKPKKSAAADKDTLNMRLKAAQIKRELIASLSDNDASERDMLCFMYVQIGADDFDRMAVVEVNQGSPDDELDQLADNKEAMPEGTSGKTSVRGQTKTDDDVFFDVDEVTGEVVER
jgi:hypothetical protein